MKPKRYAKWDLHHHIVPKFYVDEMKKLGVTVAGLKWPSWNAGDSIRMMNRFGIEKAFVSLSTPGVFFGTVEYSRTLNRRCNQYIASMIREYPGRFGGFGSVTLPDVPSALEEAEYVLDTLKLDGIVLMSNVNGRYLGDESYGPFFEELNRRKAVVFVHPNEVPGKSDHLFLNPLYLWQNDTTRTIIEFVHSGYHTRFPDIRWIFSHGGGIIAPLFPALVETLRKESPGIAEELRIWKDQVFLDTASKAFDDQIPYLLEFSDPRHVVFGSDIGWANGTAVSAIEKSYSALDRKYGLNEHLIGEVFMENAKRLLSEGRVPVRNHRPVSLPLPEFGGDAVRIQYHCHSEREARALLESGSCDRVLVSFVDPGIRPLGPEERQVALRAGNDTAAKIRAGSPRTIGAFCTIDPSLPEWSVGEIDRGLNELELDGICLALDIFETPLHEVIDERVMRKIASAGRPVLIHPVHAEGIPLISENRLESLYFIAKSFYLDLYKEYFQNTQLILAHTGGCLQYLAQPFGMLYYLSPRISARSMFALIWDTYVMHKPKGYGILKHIVTV